MIPNTPLGSELIQQVLMQLHDDLADCHEGSVADYIPELAKANADDFGIVLATVDGRIYAVGDADQAFTIQSISKPFMYGLALQLLSPALLKAKVGVEPSGDAFNAISLDPLTGIPRNPMINAGAIATAAQVWAHAPERAETTTLSYFSSLAGRELQVDEAVYRSERDSGHRNRAISHLLRNVCVIEAEPEAGLDLYFRQCSIAVTCRDLAVMAATLACQGRNPLTQECPLDPLTTTRMLAVMGSCGMYDFAGQWLYDVGMPAKSGVGGGVLAVVPGRLGIAVYSPRLDSYGNSVRGIAACRRLSEDLGLHLFAQNPRSQCAVRSSYRGTERQSRRWRPEAENAWLAPRRCRIAILHAQGVLDFAAMEQLLAQLQAAASDASVIVLDLGQVTELSAAGAVLLHRQGAQLRSSGISLLLCRPDHLELVETPGKCQRPPLEGQAEALSGFPSLDQALEAAEEQLLSTRPQNAPAPAGSSTEPSVTDPSELEESAGLLDQLPPAQRAALTARLQWRPFTAGEVVIARQQESDHLFLVASGRFSISLPIQPHSGQPGCSPARLARMTTFSAGMVFGDASFLSGRRRMADVVTETDGACWVLHRRDFEQLQRDDPATAMGLLTLLAIDLGQKLTLCGQQLTQVEHL